MRHIKSYLATLAALFSTLHTNGDNVWVKATTVDPSVLDACPGYTASNVRTTSGGSTLTADLTLAGPGCNVFGVDLPKLTLAVQYETSKPDAPRRVLFVHPFPTSHTHPCQNNRPHFIPFRSPRFSVPPTFCHTSNFFQVLCYPI